MNAVVSARADYLTPAQLAAVVLSFTYETREAVILLIRWDGSVTVRPLVRASDRDLKSHAYVCTYRHPLNVPSLEADIRERLDDIAAGWIG